MAKKKFNLFENEFLEVSEIFKQKDKIEDITEKQEEFKQKELLLKEEEKKYLKNKFNKSNNDNLSNNEFRNEIQKEKINELEVEEVEKTNKIKHTIIIIFLSIIVIFPFPIFVLLNLDDEKVNVEKIETNKKTIEIKQPLTETKPIGVKSKEINYNNLTKEEYRDLIDKINKEDSERKKNEIILNTINLFKKSYFVDNNDFDYAKELFSSYDKKSIIKTIDPELEKIFFKIRENFNKIEKIKELYKDLQLFIGINKIYVSYQYSYGIKTTKYPEFSLIHFTNILNNTDYELNFDEIKSIEVKNNGIEIFSDKYTESIEILNKNPEELKDKILIFVKELNNYDKLEFPKKFEKK